MNLATWKSAAALGVGVVVVLAIGGAAKPEKLPEPAATCFEVNGLGQTYNILIVGESWASGAKELPDLPDAASKRMNGRKVLACSIGFSGRTSQQIVGLLKSNFPKSDIQALFDGQKIDNVVILTGVNDVLQHVGCGKYAENVAKIANYFDGAGSIQVVSVPRVNEKISGSVFRVAKRWSQDVLNDGGHVDVVDKYRRQLTAKSPKLATIDYDKFAGPYETNKALFKDDGIHLTTVAFHQYGTFLGDHIALTSTQIARVN